MHNNILRDAKVYRSTLTVLFFLMSLSMVFAAPPLAKAAPAVAPVNFLLLKYDGPFSHPALSYATGDKPRYLSAGFLNGDSYVDFAVPSDPDGTPIQSYVYVHMNNGFGGLQSRIPLPVIADSHHTYIADINGDTLNDILVAHPQDDTPAFSIILQDTNNHGSFKDAVSYQINGANANGRDMITGDFNNDGHTDIAIGLEITDVDGELKILLNNGSGNYNGTDFTVAHTFIGGNSSGLDIADIDNDTFSDDLLWTEYNTSGKVTVFIGNGNISTPYSGGGTSYPVHDFPYDGQFIDANGDGILDILVGGAGTIITTPTPVEPPDPSNNVTFIPGNEQGSSGVGDGTFDLASAVPTKTTAYKSRGFVAADFDGDGNVDIATASPGASDPPPNQVGQDIRVLFGDGTGNFDVANMLIYDDYWYARGIVAEDIDNDGDKDIVFTNGGNTVDTPTYKTDKINILRNNIPQ